MTSPEAPEDDSRVIDLWGFLKGVWAERLVWTCVFVVALIVTGGVAWVRTSDPPLSYEVTQSIVFSLPPAQSTAEAIQQSTAPVNEATLGYFARAAVRPPVTDIFLKSHPEFGSYSEFARGLLGQMTIYPVYNSLEVRFLGNDPTAATRYVSDLTSSFLEQLPVLTKGNPPPLRYRATAPGDPTVVPIISGGRRSLALLTAAALAALVATIVAAVRHARRRQ